MDDTDPRRIFEGTWALLVVSLIFNITITSIALLIGDALIKRMVRLGLLDKYQRKLDYVLGLTVHQFMERRLQTLVVKRNLARSVHQARVLIRQRHIAVGKQMVNIPSFLVRRSSEQLINLSATSCKRTGKLGRTKKKKAGGANKEDDE
jgi:small subunit ribosomal protein S9e